MKKYKFPMGTKQIGKILGRTPGTIRRHMRILGFEHIDPDNPETAYVINNVEELQKIEKSIKNSRVGNPNFIKKI